MGVGAGGDADTGITAFCGLDAVALVRGLAQRAAERDEFGFISYEPGPGAAERLGIIPARKLFCMTIDDLLRQAGGDAETLLDKLVGRKMTDGTKVPEYVSALALQRSDSAFPKVCGDRKVLAVCSCCRCADGVDRHFPMLDFRIEAPTGKKEQDVAVEVIARALRRNGAPDGVILYSGNSYHYYGIEPIDESEWRKFMLRCLLLEPLVDVRYVAHRLLSGRATLRITSSASKPTMPQVVACLERSSWTACPRA